MAWKEITLEIDGEEYPALMRGNEISVPYEGKEVITVKVNGSPQTVDSVSVDERDDVITLTVSAIAKERKKSDDESTEGGSTG
tara:strand:+ start:8212 stop:8460 length:249 start_codon:yes stop_codon:yes gene_type:complete